MKKITATLIAGLFATAAFAQTPATPATPAAQADVDAKTPKAAFVDNKDLKAGAQTDGKLVKKISKADAKAAAKADKAAEAKADSKDSKAAVKADAKLPAEAHTGAHGSTTATTK